MQYKLIFGSILFLFASLGFAATININNPTLPHMPSPVPNTTVSNSLGTDYQAFHSARPNVTISTDNNVQAQTQWWLYQQQQLMLQQNLIRQQHLQLKAMQQQQQQQLDARRQARINEIMKSCNGAESNNASPGEQRLCQSIENHQRFGLPMPSDGQLGIE